MFFVSAPSRTPPERFATPLQRQTYETLERLGLPYTRVETDEAIHMEDCAAIERALGAPMVKTLFLCDRKQIFYYLFVTAGDQPFSAKRFRDALGVPRVSFAPPEQMEAVLGTRVGAATAFSALYERAQPVQFVFDRAVAALPWIACSDGTTTNFLRVRTEDLLRRVLPAAGHSCTVIPSQSEDAL